mmetsp:Transcript_13100/g.14423  ORF Transcript_13100/g.14423 Transcript_13100/m.14423 type:complete len:416 (+) Transcript_13100:386-1633(+)
MVVVLALLRQLCQFWVKVYGNNAFQKTLWISSLLYITKSIIQRYIRHSQTKLYYQHNSINNRVVKNFRTIHNYYPSPFLNNGWLQTIWAGLMEEMNPSKTKYKREIVEMLDGGIVAIDWSPNSDHLKDDAPTIVVLHGVTGHSNAPYIESLYQVAVHRGYRLAVFIARGCGNLDLRSPRLFGAADTDDCRFVVQKVAQRYPHSPLYGVGFSLGSNVLTKYVGEEGSHCPLVGFVSLCNPYNFCRIFENLGFKGKVVQKMLAVSIIKMMSRHTSELKKIEHYYGIDFVNKVFKANSLLSIDDEFTCKMRGFKGALAYYQTANSSDHIKHIEIPGLFISTKDDIVCLLKGLPMEEIRAKENLMLCLTHGGGHLGFFEGLTASKQWHPEVIMDYFEGLELCRKERLSFREEISYDDDD